MIAMHVLSLPPMRRQVGIGLMWIWLSVPELQAPILETRQHVDQTIDNKPRIHPWPSGLG